MFGKNLEEQEKDLEKNKEGVVLPIPTKKNGKAPWLREDGSLRPKAEISLLGKTWPQETWDAYLDLTVGDLKDDENLVFFPHIDTPTVLEGLKKLHFFQHKKYNPLLRFLFELALEELSRTERAIIKKFFWEEETHSEIAKSLGISPATVRVLKGRGLKKMKSIFSSGALIKKIANTHYKTIYTNGKKTSQDNSLGLMTSNG